MSRPDTGGLPPPARNPCAPTLPSAVMWWDGGERAITAREKALIEEHSASCFSIPLVPASGERDWCHDARMYGDALNDAAWVFIEQCPEKSALLFNSAKVVLRSAILRYAERVSGYKAPTEANAPTVLRSAAAVLQMWEDEPDRTGYMGDFGDACEILELLARHGMPITAQEVCRG